MEKIMQTEVRKAKAKSKLRGRHPKPPYPKQRLEKPGIEAEMKVKPRWRAPYYKASGKLAGKVALVTGGDSGIGRAVAYLYAREGADVAIVYLPAEETDAAETEQAVLNEGRHCLKLPGDLTEARFCRNAVEKTVKKFGRLDILVSNAVWQNRKENIEDISDAEWSRTFRTNIDAYFYLVRAALKHMKAGASIIATSSVVGLVGNEALADYAATKGAIDAFTKSLAQMLAPRGIRANVVAPGPVWTPLNPADTGIKEEKLARFGGDTMPGRAAQPEEIAPAYVFLASEADSSYISGTVLEEIGKTMAG
jgi:NAD(P)-dependent dehydrogenase (short-subunit alcohol dehydrogenase family)